MCVHGVEKLRKSSCDVNVPCLMQKREHRNTNDDGETQMTMARHNCEREGLCSVCGSVRGVGVGERGVCV